MEMGLNRLHGAMAMGEQYPSPRLIQAAHEFEGQMMKELLKPITDSGALTGDESDGELNGGGGVLGEFAGEALGQALSQRGGFGIADRIVAQLSRFGTGIQAPKDVSSTGGSGGMRKTE